MLTQCNSNSDTVGDEFADRAARTRWLAAFPSNEIAVVLLGQP